MWNHIYYLLAAFDVLALSGSLYLNHQIMEVYAQSVDENYVWADRITSLEQLRNVAIAVNAPGNDVFDDGKVTLHRNNRDKEYSLFQSNITMMSQEYKQINNSRLRTTLLAHVNKIDAAMTAMNEEANFIFKLFSQAKGEQAGSRMATMDRKAANVQYEISHLIHAINQVQERNFKQQIANAKNLKQFEYMIAVIILIMVIMVTVYGHKLAKTIRNYQDKLQGQFNKLREQAKRIKNSEQRSRAILEAVPDGIIIVNENCIIESMNRSAQEQFGYRESDCLGKSLHELIGQNDDTKGMSDDILSNFNQEILLRRKDGDEFHAEISITSFEHSSESKFTGVIRDVTERKIVQNEIEQLAMNDSLTGLANRNKFSQWFDQTLKSNLQEKKMTALMMLDLDRFKYVNDTYGHPIGDKLLIKVAERLKSLFRDNDIIARLGGDEFAIVLGGLDNHQIVKKAAIRIIKTLSTPFIIDDTRLDIGSSIGISLSPDDDTTIVELIRKSDLALYKAKENGRGTYTFFTQQMHEEITSSKKLESRLRIAFEQSQLELHYQPQVRTIDNAIYGCEALIRWHDEDEGFISPTLFVPLAEQSDLIIEIDNWVLMTACKQWVKWKQFNISATHLSVNVSAKKFEDPDFISDLANIIKTTNMPPKELQLELTEAAALNDLESCIETIKHIRELGVPFAIDDFGTGHSSLTYLRRLPLDVVKIDRSFVKNILTEPAHEIITESLIKLSKSLNIDVIAEGVEVEEIKNVLENMGCHHIQGYFYYKPMPADEMQQLLIEP